MIALALLAASIAGRHEFREIHMGVEVRIVLHADDTERAATAARAAFDRVRAWDDALSDWRPDTPAQRLPTRAGESRRVDGRLRHALDASWRMGTSDCTGWHGCTHVGAGAPTIRADAMAEPEAPAADSSGT